MDAGEMRERITLKSRGTPTKDARGHETITWVTIGTVWAKYAPVRSDERFAAAQVQDDIAVRFFIRARTDLDSTCRLEWKSIGYDIVAATPLTDPAWMELIARKGVKDGR